VLKIERGSAEAWRVQLLSNGRPIVYTGGEVATYAVVDPVAQTTIWSGSLAVDTEPSGGPSRGWWKVVTTAIQSTVTPGNYRLVVTVAGDKHEVDDVEVVWA
jgi:hypothetical protein